MSGKRKQKRGGTRPAGVSRDAAGRAHLLVVQGDRLALARPLFEEGWQDQVALGAATTAHGLLAAGHTVANAAALGRTAMDATSKIADGALAQAPERPPACRAGCAHCCHQPVGVTPPELFAIYDELRASRSPAELAAVADRVRAADDRTRGLAPAARISSDHPCPFLEAGRCTIYEARPLACRGTNSLDADACARNLHDPVAHAAYVAGTASVPCYREPIRAFHAVTAGLQLALDELHGLEVLPLELTAAMRVLLDDPDGAPAQWLGGKDPFAGARGGDNSDDPQMRALAGAVIRP